LTFIAEIDSREASYTHQPSLEAES